MGGRISMFKFLSIREQLLEERRRNEALKALNIDLENALLEWRNCRYE